MQVPAFADEQLPLLAEAASPELMLGAFRDYFRQRYPDWTDRILACDIKQVRYEPGRSCRFVYQLQLRGEPDSFNQWFVGKMYATGDAPAPDPQRDADETHRHGPWKSVDDWPEMQLTLSAFQFDRKLPALQKLLDPTEVMRLAQARSRACGLAADWRCERALVHPWKYMPRKRCLLRLDLDWRHPTGDRKRLSVFSKTYRKKESRSIYAGFEAVSKVADASRGRLVIPHPVCHIESLNTIWQEAWPGKSLRSTVEDGSWEQYLPAVASSLAALHQGNVGDVALRSEPTPAERLDGARGDEKEIAAFFGAPRPEVRRIVKELEARCELLQAKAIPRKTTHGTFKLSQVLVRDSRVAVIDFDDVALGDPLYDVADFISSIVVLRVKQGLSVDHVIGGARRFLQAYEDEVPWDCDRTRIRWYGTTLLLRKVHSALKRLRAADEDQFKTNLGMIETDLPLVLGPTVR